MKKLFDEIYENEGKSNRNIWYSETKLTNKMEYGSLIQLSIEQRNSIIKQIQDDLLYKKMKETNWYFYDISTNKDVLGENVRISLMIREKDQEFKVQFNISDYNFATNLDQILLLQSELKHSLENIFYANSNNFGEPHDNLK